MAVAERAMRLETPVRKERSPWGDAWYQLTRNRVAVGSLIFIFLVALVAIFAPVIAPYHFAEGNLEDNYALPGDKYLAGADFMGRDILSRTIYGTRISMSVAIVASMVSLVVGVTVGVISGYAGGRVDNIIMRIVDIIYAYPFIVFVILMQVYFKALSRRGGAEGLVGAIIELDSKTGGMLFVFIAIGLINWLDMARLTRGQVLSYKEKEFVEAARSIGASDGRIILRHLLPNIIGPLIVNETLQIPTYIFLEAFLSFIGLGVNPPTPSWGAMISEGFQGLRSYPHLIAAPAVALCLTVLAFNFLGDGLRDALDPRLRGTT
ncbi:MAG TPA: ABC transporter permease [Anaerolineae bacterium]|nr:ABC transporter permease [Anaerolineae bacterium]